MIHSLFLINHTGDIFLEKHWKSVVSRSVCDYFFEAREKAVDPENVPPVLQTPHHYLISIYRGKLFFLSVIQNEVPPLFVIEFLHRVADTIQVWHYFGNVALHVYIKAEQRHYGLSNLIYSYDLIWCFASVSHVF